VLNGRAVDALTASSTCGRGVTGVELAGELAEMLPEVASGYGLAPELPGVLLVEAGPTSWLALRRS
jgi:NADH dehydrogenase FAD-containing subunit